MTEELKKLCCIQRKKRAALLERLRVSISCPISATIRERMEIIAKFREENPNYSINILADTVGVSRSGFREYLWPRSKSKGIFFNHRVEIAEAVERLAEEDWQYRVRRPGLRFAVRQLRERGHTCSIELLSDILKNMGYDREVEKMP